MSKKREVKITDLESLIENIRKEIKELIGLPEGKFKKHFL